MTSIASGLRLANDTVELAVMTDAGPRVLHYSFLGGENIFGELPDAVVKTPWGNWHPWGGHRLWIAPENMPGSYTLDQTPVGVQQNNPRHVVLLQKLDPRVGVEKRMEIELDEDGTGVTVRHTIINRTIWHIDVAPWAITIMRSGGEAILPQEPYRSHDDAPLPARQLILWPYTDLTDPRVRIGKKLIRFVNDPKNQVPQKIGISNRPGWAAYRHGDTVFLKQVKYHENSRYPDMGASTETYSEGELLELETLAPLRTLAPNENAEHVERWQLVRLTGARGGAEEELLLQLGPHINREAPDAS